MYGHVYVVSIIINFFHLFPPSLTLYVHGLRKGSSATFWVIVIVHDLNKIVQYTIYLYMCWFQ